MKFRFFATLILTLACGQLTYSQNNNQPQKWSIVIHGGAGGAPKSMTPERKAQYEKHLLEALEMGRKMLQEGRASLM